MKIIWIKPYNSPRFYNNFFNIDKNINPFYKLDKKLLKNKIKLKILKPYSSFKYRYKLVCADTPYPWNVDIWLKILKNGRKNNVLICFDSPLVVPFNHWKVMRRFFGKIYTYNDSMVDGKNFIKYNLPQVEPLKEFIPKPFTKKRLLVMVSSKKSAFLPFKLLSPYKDDYYSERLKLVKFLNNNCPEDFDLYGHGWYKADRYSLKERVFGFQKFGVYKGSVKDKLETLSNYKYCVAFENTSAPGYITEKIFDCFWAGTVPIYLGAPNIKDYIPEDCFIDFKDFSSYKALLDYIVKMDKNAYENYLIRIDKFIRSKSTKDEWFGVEFMNIFKSLFK